jgi:hypothetical protein
MGLAWLPLLLLCFERAVRRGSIGWAGAAGIVLAMIVLGTHPQWTLYSVILLALWTARAGVEGAQNGREYASGILRWAGLGLFMAVVAGLLAAVQLLPTLEATGESCRHHLGMAHPSGNGSDLRSAIPAWLGLVGPALEGHANWEHQTGIGLGWAMAAAAGVWLGGRAVWHRSAACLVLFAFALTGGLFLHELPGLNLFRGPNRMLLLTSLPVAMLAGHAVDRLPATLATARGRQQLAVGLVFVATVALAYTGWRVWRLPEDQRFFRRYWLTLAASIPLLVGLVALPTAQFGRSRAVLWCVVLLMDLWALSSSLVDVRRQAHIYPRFPMLDFLAGRRDDFGRVLDLYPVACMSPLGCGAPLAVNEELHPVRGYNPLDYYRYKSFLRMLSDSDSPVAPCEVVDGFPLTHRSLLDLLGVRYLLVPRGQSFDEEGWSVALADDTEPTAFNYPYQGMNRLPAYTVYENEQVLPRAFVVPRAELMPAGQEHEAMLAADFQRTVLVEGCDPMEIAAGDENSFRAARIDRYRPNEVRIHVTGNQPGWLVLTDLWFPGWVCTVDGERQTIYPANQAFRAVPIGAGQHDVVFRFEPRSVFIGRWITLDSLFTLAIWAATAFAIRMRSSGSVAPAVSGMQCLEGRLAA